MLPLLLLSKTQRQPSYLVSNLICHVHSHTDTHISDSSCTDQLSLCLKSDIWLSDKTSWFWILVWIVSNLDIHHIHCALCLNTLDTASSFIKLLLLEAILHFHPSTFATNTLHYLLYCIHLFSMSQTVMLTLLQKDWNHVPENRTNKINTIYPFDQTDSTNCIQPHAISMNKEGAP